MKFKSQDWFIPLIYLVLGIAWIGFSDDLILYMTQINMIKTDHLFIVGKIKGFGYVIFTAILLYYLIKQKTNDLLLVKNDFRRLFYNNPNPMYIFDVENKKILLVNKAATLQYGYSRKEFLEKNLYDLRPASETENLNSHLKELESSFVNSGDWLHHDKNGNTFYVNIFSHETTYKGRQCRLVTAINVNQKVMAEIDRANIQKALDKAALVSITDTKGIIQEINDAYCQVSQYSREELIGKPIMIFDAQYHEQEFWTDMWDTINAGEIWRGNVQNQKKFGETFWIDMVISPIKNHKGEIYKFMSVNYDITEKKALEISQKALLDDFANYAYQTSHELRAPLTNMLGLISIFKKYDNPEDLIDRMRVTSIQMDKVIRKMNDSLNKNAFSLINDKKELEKTYYKTSSKKHD